MIFAFQGSFRKRALYIKGLSAKEPSIPRLFPQNSRAFQGSFHKRALHSTALSEPPKEPSTLGPFLQKKTLKFTVKLFPHENCVFQNSFRKKATQSKAFRAKEPPVVELLPRKRPLCFPVGCLAVLFAARFREGLMNE